MNIFKTLSAVGLFILGSINFSAFAFEDDGSSEKTFLVFPYTALDEFYVVHQNGAGAMASKASIVPVLRRGEHFEACNSQVQLVEDWRQTKMDQTELADFSSVDRQTFYLCSYEPFWSQGHFWQDPTLQSITVSMLDCAVVVTDPERGNLAVVSASGLPALETRMSPPRSNMSTHEIAKFVEEEFHCDYVQEICTHCYVPETPPRWEPIIRPKL